MVDISRSCGNSRRNIRTANGSAANPRRGTNCAPLSLRLKQVEFALSDVILYLDAYPTCAQALAYYYRLIEERKALVTAINEQCGPLTSLENSNPAMWEWIEGPWPWNVDAD